MQWYRIAWIAGRTGGGILKGTDPHRKGGTCQGLSSGPKGIRCYDDVQGSLVVRNGNLENGRSEVLCRLDEVEAVWKLNGDEVGKRVHP